MRWLIEIGFDRQLAEDKNVVTAKYLDITCRIRVGWNASRTYRLIGSAGKRQYKDILKMHCSAVCLELETVSLLFVASTHIPCVHAYSFIRL